MPLLDALDDGFADADVVVDLSDEPVLGPRRAPAAREPRARGRSSLRGRRLPVRPAPLRTVCAAVARRDRYGQARRQDGGDGARRTTARPTIARSSWSRWGGEGRPSPKWPRRNRPSTSLLELSRQGRHAASDYLETAALTGVRHDRLPACRRRACRGGDDVERLGGRSARGRARPRPRHLRRQRRGDSADRGGRADSRQRSRPRSARATSTPIVSSCPTPSCSSAAAMRLRVRALKRIPVVSAELRLRPVEPVTGRRVAVFTTGPAPTEHLDADVVSVSRNLADRAKLREDLGAHRRGRLSRRDQGGSDRRRRGGGAGTRGREIVFAENEVVSADLDDVVAKLVPARARV